MNFVELGVFSLNCMIGKGDLYTRPASNDDIQAGNYPSMDAPFQSYKCGTRGSQLINVDTLIKNVTDTIENTWDTFTETITNLATGAGGADDKESEAEKSRRFKREQGEQDKKRQNYACVKVVLGYTAYRSCVPKYSTIRLNCSSFIGGSAVCYCHTDDCNASWKLLVQPWFVLLLLYLTI